MNIKRLVLILLCIILMAGQAQAISFQEKPDWLQGSLLVSTMASDEILPSDRKPVMQAVCMMDFNNESLTEADIPSNATLFSDPADGTPIVFYPQNPCYAVSETAYQDQNWKKFGYARLISSAEGLTVQNSGDQVFTDRYPVALLSLSVDADKAADLSTTGSFFATGQTYTRIYFCYGVSDDGKGLEIQLIAETGEAESDISDSRILKTFDVNCLVGSMWFAFSKDRCAISDSGGNISSINTDSLTETCCPEKANGAVCWLDDRLIYCVTDEWQPGRNNNHCLLKLWDTETGRVASLADLWGGDEIDLSVAQAPLSMAVNRDSTILAIYFSSSFDEDRPAYMGGKIVFISLINGETYEITPWDQLIENGYTSSCCKTDDGIVIYAPSDLIDTRLVWYCE